MHWYLSFAIKRDRVAQTISINQRAYIEAMLNKFRLTNAKPVSMPMESGTHFTKDQAPSTPTQAIRMRGMPYAEAIGCVLWPVMITRPDCAFTSGYPRSDPIRLNNFSLALSLIGFFLYGLPGQIFFVPGLSQDKTYRVANVPIVGLF